MRRLAPPTQLTDVIARERP